MPRGRAAAALRNTYIITTAAILTLAQLAAAQTPLGDEFLVNTVTSPWESEAAIAGNSSGNFVIVWNSSYVHGDPQGGLYGRRFTSGGTPVSGEFHVNTFSAGRQEGAAVAMNSNGQFVVVWDSY